MSSGVIAGELESDVEGMDEHFPDNYFIHIQGTRIRDPGIMSAKFQWSYRIIYQILCYTGPV